jgi:hypothetical protein
MSFNHYESGDTLDKWLLIMKQGVIDLLGLLGIRTQGSNRIPINEPFLCISWHGFSEVFHTFENWLHHNPLQTTTMSKSMGIRLQIEWRIERGPNMSNNNYSWWCEFHPPYEMVRMVHSYLMNIWRFPKIPRNPFDSRIFHRRPSSYWVSHNFQLQKYRQTLLVADDQTLLRQPFRGGAATKVLRLCGSTIQTS